MVCCNTGPELTHNAPCHAQYSTMDEYTFRVYSNDHKRSFTQQEPVFVWLKSDRSTGAAVVQQTPDSLPPDSPYAGRYLVHFNTGQIAHVRPERLLPVFQQPKLILVTAATEDYRRLARSQVRLHAHSCYNRSAAALSRRDVEIWAVCCTTEQQHSWSS